MEPLEQRVRRVTSERVDIVGYDPSWAASFQRERTHLLECLPPGIIVRIEHFGSTAVPGLSAKPIIDMLVEVTSLERVRGEVVPVLEAQGYDYFWRPTSGDDIGPFYAWFIKRDPSGVRTHHIHMVERGFSAHWERLLFRDYLIAHPDVARRYADLKRSLAGEPGIDRVRYTQAKSAFIEHVMQAARGE